MGRELRRKQAKKEGKSLKTEKIVEKNQIKSLIIITCILLVISAIIYLLSALFITKELDWFDTTNESDTTSVSNSVLASSIFKQSEDVYYVYFYDFDDEDSDITSTITNTITEYKIYKVNTGSAMNSNYVSETSNPKAKTLGDLKVVSPTLIKISGETISEYYENDEIFNNLK